MASGSKARAVGGRSGAGQRWQVEAVGRGWAGRSGLVGQGFTYKTSRINVGFSPWVRFSGLSPKFKNRPKKKGTAMMTVQQFRASFGDGQQCGEHLSRQRWPEGFACPRCGGSSRGYMAVRQVHKIRKAMSDRDQRYRLSGLVEVDEGRFGGEEACAACPTAPASRFADRNEKSTKWGNREQGVEDLALGTLLSTPSPLRSVFAVFPAGLSSVAKKRSSPS
jgi:hypothetical protein